MNSTPARPLNAARDRPWIRGAFLGAALGDAVGLQAEGRDAGTLADRFPNGLGYPGKGAGREGFPPNAWSDVTEQAILVMQTLAAYFTAETDDPTLDFATRLAAWHKTGVSALDAGANLRRARAKPAPPEARPPGEPLRPVQFTHDGPRPPRRTPADTTTRAIATEGFLADPVEAARAIVGPKADNGALYRTIACAFTSAPAEWALTFAEVTHADERCGASAVMLSCLVRELVLAASQPGGLPQQLTALAQGPVAAGRELIQVNSPRRPEYMRRLTESSAIRQLGLGLRDDQAYTLKTLAAAMWALRQLVRTPSSQRGADLFRRIILELAAEGGSASANCAVAGCVIGAALGDSALPPDWLAALPLAAEYAQEIDSFLGAAEASKAWA